MDGQIVDGGWIVGPQNTFVSYRRLFEVMLKKKYLFVQIYIDWSTDTVDKCYDWRIEVYLSAALPF